MSETLSSPVATLAVPSVPTDDRHTRLMGLSIVFVAFAGFGVWGATARLDSAVVAPGVVMVESYRKTVQHLEGGIVKDILVRDGDSVQAGDILLRLDETQARASLEIARSKYLATRALEARLSAERDLRQSIAFPEELLRLRGGDPRVQEILDGQGGVFRARHEGPCKVRSQSWHSVSSNCRCRWVASIRSSKPSSSASFR